MTTDRDLALRETYQLGAEPEGDRSRCPSSAELAHVLEKGLGLGRFEQHVASCSACADELRLVAPLEAMVEATIGAPVRPAAKILFWNAIPSRKAIAAVLVLAAAVAIAVGLSVVLESSRPSPSGSETIVRGGARELRPLEPREGVALNAPPAQFSWESVKGADGYRLTLFDSESTPLWTSPLLRRASLDIPPDVARSLSPGRYYWRVTILDGVRESTTPLFRFSVTR